MVDRPLKLAKALRVLPETGSLVGLREALIADSHAAREAAWGGAGDYATLEQREARAARMLERIPALAERERARSERKLRHAVQALQAVEEGDEAKAARELVRAGEVAEAARELEEAERFFEAAIALGRKPRDRTGEALARLRLARVHRARGSTDEALREYRAGFEIAGASRDLAGVVVACQGLGNVHVDRGEWGAARSWYREGLERTRERGPCREEWELCSNLAIVARREGDLDESARWLQRAREVVEALDDEAGAFFLENGTGRLLVARGDAVGAEAAFRRALGRATDDVRRTLIFVNLAEALLLQGRLQDAEELARKAEEMALVHRVPSALPEIYRLLGAVARERKGRDGFVFFEQALALLRAAPDPSMERALTQHQYGLFHARLGEVELARARLQAAITTYEALSAHTEAEQAGAELAALAGGSVSHPPASSRPVQREDDA